MSSRIPGRNAEEESKISREFENWQTKLLQLDRRNNLLYFKEGRSAVPLPRVSPKDVDTWVESTQKGLRFAELDEDANGRSRKARGTTIATGMEPPELRRRLRALHRRDREWEEEQGLNVLFLAVGFLEWIDAGSETARSPLALIPCDLERASPQSPWVLKREDDVPEINATLGHQLRDFGVTLPELGDSEITSYLGSVRNAIAEKESWSVQEDVWLATFAFSKMAMYEDLERMGAGGVDNPLVRKLAGATAEPPVPAGDGGVPGPGKFPPDTELVGGRFDDLLDVRRQFAVLDADFSQLRAIEAARNGQHLVIHGPPGTGKSQTITNMIATLLADRKRVLFVSEKTAALDVVKRKLDECGLGVFCLDLHSDRAKKESVYEQLKAALSDARRLEPDEFPYEKLTEQRDRLNNFVRALHRNRAPLGLTAYQVQGKFALVQSAPDVEFEVNDVASLEGQRLQQIEEAAQKIKRRPDEFREHQTGQWAGLIVANGSMGLADEIRKKMDRAVNALAASPEQIANNCDWTGIPTATTVEACAAAAEVLDHLSRGPGIPALWLKEGVLARLQQQASQQAEQQQRRQTLEAAMRSAFEDTRPVADFRAVRQDLDRAELGSRAVEALFGKHWRQRVTPDPGGCLERGIELAEAGNEAADAAERLSKLLLGGEVRSVGDLSARIKLATRLVRLSPVPKAWLVPKGVERAEAALSLGEDLLKQLRRAEDDLPLTDFEERIVEIVDRPMRERFRSDYKEWFGLRRFSASYKRDIRELQSALVRMDRRRSPSEWRHVVDRAFNVRQLREKYAAAEGEFRCALGDRYRGRGSDLERTHQDLWEFASLQDEWPRNTPMRKLMTDRAVGGALASALGDAESALDRLESARAAFERSGSTVADESRAENAEAPKQSEPLADLATRVADAREPLEALARAVGVLGPHLRRPATDLEALSKLTADLIRLTELERHDEDMESGLMADFGDRFTGPGTDWAAIQSVMDWTQEALAFTPKGRSTRLTEHLVSPLSPTEYIERAKVLRTIRKELAECIHPAIRCFLQDHTAWGDWRSVHFDELRSWAAGLSADAPSASAWLDYRRAIGELEELIGRGAVDRIRAVTDVADEVPRIVRRRVFRDWLDEVYRQDQHLRGFSTADHEHLRGAFARLDSDQRVANRRRVRSICFGRYPDPFSPNAGNIGLLRGELSKRRRRMPVRRLIRRIPDVLQALKPCMLMSPLAVSQYLPRGDLKTETMEFDAVIFDEASQVFPEDAVPAIARAKQAIVAGDEQQLPPTSFFRRSREDADDDHGDEDLEIDESQTAGRESILAVMVGMVGSGVAEQYLTTHYRSQHEDLIRYSNHYFYDDKLLVFPAPGRAVGNLGIRDIHVPNGRFEAGASRTNPIEAERVVELVFDAMDSTPPHESVGVVALSRPQADLIERLLELRRLEERSLDARFDESLRERFFVKNLENVQGDERDHIILSIGYGPTLGSDKVRQIFGPINTEKGDRRLNVAVSRARRTMTLVRSLEPNQISKGSKRNGPRRLRQYLEYVRDPKRAFESGVKTDARAEPESPFEEAVCRALIRRGHDVVPQVGVAGYRIDLGVRSEDEDSFDLGIECDGARYHSAPAARDRDRLRQEVIEGLGWKIHRIWSTAWTRDPKAEIEKIEKSLERARSSPRKGSREKAKRHGEPNQSVEAAASDESDQPPSSEPHPALFERYKKAPLENIWGVGTDPVTEDDGVLRRLVDRVVEVEGPVHLDLVVERIRQRYGLKRAGNRIRGRVERALRERGAGRRNEKRVFFHVSGHAAVPRRSTPDGPSRKINHIAESELEAGILMLVGKSFGCDREELIGEAARQFGFQRTGAVITERLTRVIARLKRKKLLEHRFGSLVVADS